MTKKTSGTLMRPEPLPNSSSWPVVTPLSPSVVYASLSPDALDDQYEGRVHGYTYSREGHPNADVVTSMIDRLEGCEGGVLLGSGMAAVTASMLCQLSAGDHVVAARALFGSCRYIVEDLLPRFGVESTLVDGCDLDQWRQARRPNTKVFFLETPTNPTLDIIDLKAVAEIAHDAGARLVVDNVFATPVLQKPLKFGADVVVYSATKHIDGQGRCLGGVVLASDEFVTDHLANFLRQTGPALSPFNAWVMLKSLETLDLRVQRHCENAITVADFLGRQDKIARVIYPGRSDHPQHNLAAAQMKLPGNMIAFEVKGGKEAAFRLANQLGVIKISNNLGDAKSLITHPATTTHQRLTPEARAELGISDAMLRLSVGLEDADDLTDDIGFGLDAA